MGRHRISEEEKKVQYNIKITKKLLDELRDKLKEENMTATYFFEQKIQEFLKK